MGESEEMNLATIVIYAFSIFGCICAIAILREITQSARQRFIYKHYHSKFAKYSDGVVVKIGNVVCVVVASYKDKDGFTYKVSPISSYSYPSEMDRINTDYLFDEESMVWMNDPAKLRWF